MYCVDSSNGQLYWKVEVSTASILSSPIILREHVYAATLNGTVAKLDLNSGHLIWKINLFSPVFSSPAITHVYLPPMKVLPRPHNSIFPITGFKTCFCNRQGKNILFEPRVGRRIMEIRKQKLGIFVLGSLSELHCLRMSRLSFVLPHIEG